MAWIGAVALVVSIAVGVGLLRRGASREMVTDRVVAVWLAAALVAVAILTLRPLAAEFNVADPQLNPLPPINARDAFDNVMLYVPVGFFAAILWRSRPNPVFRALVLVLATSLALEVAQWVLPINRAASIHDVLFNTIGGLAGAGVGVVVARIPVKSSE